MKRDTEILSDHSPLSLRIFVGVAGLFLMVIATAAATQRAIWPAVTMYFIGVLLVTVLSLRWRKVLDRAGKELVCEFRWLFWRRRRQIPLTSIAHLYVQALGKGGREIG